jgi:hypothetical protein
MAHWTPGPCHRAWPAVSMRSNGSLWPPGGAPAAWPCAKLIGKQTYRDAVVQRAELTLRCDGVIRNELRCRHFALRQHDLFSASTWARSCGRRLFSYLVARLKTQRRRGLRTNPTCLEKPATSCMEFSIPAAVRASRGNQWQVFQDFRRIAVMRRGKEFVIWHKIGTELRHNASFTAGQSHLEFA